uniref:Uncharacterized protein n=1 Tax=Bos mutus grunniens TaxID=30521 RepID=A0A8C0A4F4_BOSMU
GARSPAWRTDSLPAEPRGKPIGFQTYSYSLSILPTPRPPLMPEKKIEVRCVFSLQENAVNGEHLWLETNVSGDLCYLGEESCQVRFAVSVRPKSALRRKCAVCKIVVHTACIEQLEKVRHLFRVCLLPFLLLIECPGERRSIE